MKKLKCIGIIPDGNRRFAKRNNISLIEAYKIGTNKAWEAIGWLSLHKEIKDGIFYTLSLENFYKRSKLELKVLFKIFEKELEKIIRNNPLEKFETSIKFFGKLELLPKSLNEKIKKVEEISENNGKKKIWLALCYDGQQEIVDAVKKILELGITKLQRKNFAKFLYAKIPFPDLILRTGNAKRLSGFLTFQSAYAELEFLPKLWPEIQKKDFDKVIQNFYKRERRFGR